MSANTYRLTVNKQAPQVFAWKLDGKGKTADSSAFVTILPGVHTRSVDAQGNPTTTANETMSVHSRWMETGAGRTDVQVAGGDVGTAVDTSSECWDPNFSSVYSAVSYDPNDANVDWGSESSCAFASAALVSLSPQRSNFEGPGPPRRPRHSHESTGVGNSVWREAGRFSGRVARALHHVRGTVHGRCRYILRNANKAEDAIQDVFAKALTHWSEFRSEAPPLTWLTRIATHHCLNMLRAERAPWRVGRRRRMA